MKGKLDVSSTDANKGGSGMKLSIGKKLVSVMLLLLIVPCIVIGTVSFITAKNSLDEMGEVILKNSTKQVIQMIQVMHEGVEKGAITLEEAQEIAKIFMIGEKNEDGTRNITTSINLGEYGYFFVVDENGQVLAHPTIEGEDAWEFQDSNGNYFVQSFIEKAKNGGGFVKYDFGMPDNPDRIEPKIAYAEMDPYWGWVIVPSSYMMDFNKNANQMLFILIITLAIFLFVGIAVIILFSNHLAKPLRRLTEHVKTVAKGNLSIAELEVKNNDEIGELAGSYNKMIANLKGFIGHVFDHTQHVAATSEQLSASSEQTSKVTEEISNDINKIASGAEQQTRRVREMTATVSEISTSIDHIAENIQEVNESSQKAVTTAKSGNDLITESRKQMENMKKSSSEMEKIIETLSSKSAQISSVISIITNIAEQTNLLALNAAIEAARAGERGKGFAVVADEVRKLAEESSRAGGQVDELVKDVQREVQRTIEAITENGKIIEEGIELNNKAANAFEEIAEGISQVSKQILDITSAIEQINSSTANLLQFTNEIEADVSKASENIESVAASAEEQTASVEEVAAAAEQLASMAEKLQTYIAQFHWQNKK